MKGDILPDTMRLLCKLSERTSRWHLNGDKARVSVPVGELRAALDTIARFEHDLNTRSLLPGGEAERECTTCGAGVAEWPTVMCCHCYEMPWKLREVAAVTPITPDGGDRS